MNNQEQRLRMAGLKVTPQRLTVYQILFEFGHASVDVMLPKIKQLLPTITVATIYNVLESFVQKGLISKLYTDDNKMYFDITPEKHSHLYCKQTQTMTDYFDEELQQMIQSYIQRKDISGFKLEDVYIQFIGIKQN